MNIAIIGFGSAAQYFHLPLLQKISKIKLKVAFDVSEQNKNEALVQGFEHALSIENLKNDLLKYHIDICIITSPSIFHYDQANIVLQAGINVLVDKPIVNNIKQLEELMQISTKNNCLIASFLNRRLDNDFITVSDLLAKKVIGEVKRIDISISEWGVSNKFASENFKPSWRMEQDFGGGMFNDWEPGIKAENVH